MSGWLNRLPGYQKARPGLEWRLLKRLPLWSLLATVIPAAVGAALWWTAPQPLTSADDRHLWHQIYTLIGLVIFNWTVLLTVLIGCVIVVIMKGPAYVADAYPLSDADRPAPRMRDTDQEQG